MKRRRFRIRYVETGLLLIAAALSLTLYNLYDDVRAQETSSQIMKDLQVRIPASTEAPSADTLSQPEEMAAAPTYPAQMPEETFNGQNYIGTLEIPGKKLALPVISQWSYPSLKIAPCRYSGSAYTDDLIISAHNYQAHFGQIVELEVGDQVIFTDLAGNSFRYNVILQEQLEATDIAQMESGDWDLTLFTCTIGGQYRVTVRCEREEEAPVIHQVVEQHVHGDGLTNSTVELRVQPTEPPVPEEEMDEFSLETEIPLYYQTDYPNTIYGSGTIESSGCSVTCLAMVASYLTEHEYMPDELARYFGGRAENNIARLEKGSETLQLAFSKSENWDYTYAGLKEGKIAIVLEGPDSIFTNSQHFIVLTGLTEDGRVLVHDPYEPNYSNWRLKHGFENGFLRSDILMGYSGAWLYDKAAMPEDPFIYFEPEPDRRNPRYPEIELDYEERQLLARVVWAEARGESEEGQQAVAEVVLNRMASDNFPDGIRDVIYGEGQFRSVSVLDKAQPYQAQYDAIERAVYGPYVLPEDVVYFATFQTNENVWGQIGGHIFCYEND